MDDHGKADFEACNAGFRSSKKRVPVVYMAFDILYHRGVDVTSLPLERRKQLLEESLQENEQYRIVQPIQGSAEAFFDIVCHHGLEGIVIKKKSSKYEKGVRSWSWRDWYMSGAMRLPVFEEFIV